MNKILLDRFPLLPVFALCLAMCGIGFPREARADQQDFPAVDLRGYGTLAGQVTTGTADGSKTSVLTIQCDDEAKAKLVQAKYLSDFQILPGVKPVSITGKEGEIPAYAAEDQGAVLAERDGSTVRILAAASPDALAKLEAAAPGGADPVFKPEVAVPMYLDRFDQFGFRFYMSVWQTPPHDRNYDLTQEYDFAAQSDRSGMQFWADTCKVNTAEGLTNDVFWDWGAQAARERNIPLGINTNAGFEAPVWLMNRYRDQAAQKMPGYVGCFYDTGVYNLGAPGWLSWAATTGEDALLAVLQQSVRNMQAYPNVTSYMEPHAETQHGVPDVLLEYGPVPDASYRGFLKNEYGSIEALNAAWQTRLASWTKVRVPELVTFLGYGPGVIDLGGEWRIGYEPASDGKPHSVNDLATLATSNIQSAGAPDDWFSEKFDDGTWPKLTIPGDDVQTLLPRWPAVFRRSFTVPAGWAAKHPKSWIYIWDLNRGNKGAKVIAAINGRQVGSGVLPGGSIPHIAIFPVNSALRDGVNEVAIRTPQGRINYKVYISGEEPLRYPNLGEAKNMQWADFIDWDVWVRGDAIRKGMEMIRQVDPNKGIMLASPDTYAEQIKDDARNYGGDFHNTGYMGGWWCDRLPAWMRGAGLPMSVEPGNPAHNVSEFQGAFGNWITEGVNAVDYFLNIGDVLWDPQIKAYFDQNLKVIRLIGKYHAPFADVAALYSSHIGKLMDFPWGGEGFSPDPAPITAAAFVSGFNSRGYYGSQYESDAVTETSFSNGDAARYKVVTDCNTSVLDDKTVSAIEKYVSDGGVFITFGDTGRHLPGKRDAWPISRITGYKVLPVAMRSSTKVKLEAAPGQQIYPADWTTMPQGDGQSLEKTAPDATDLLRWSNGTVAAGMRKIGKGYIIDLGCRSSRENDAKLFTYIFKWLNIPAIPAHVEPAQSPEIFRHYVSNNGLYDVWTIWNTNRLLPLNATVVMDDSLDPHWAIRVKDGAKVPVANHRLSVTIPALETAFYLTPRGDITEASTEWLKLQRGWWRGTVKPLMKPLPPPEHKRSVDLNADWAFKPVADSDDVAALTGTNVDDSKWQRLPMGIWTFTPGNLDVHHAVFRKTVTVPATWTHGEPTFWLRAWDGDTFRDGAQIYIDGKAIYPTFSAHGPEGINPDGVFKPGSTHTIAVEIKATRTVDGANGNAWLWYWPDPKSSIDLAGKWDSSPDGLTYDKTVPIPGPFIDKVIRTSVTVPARHRGQRTVLEIETQGPIHNVIVNGHLVARHHHNIGEHWELDVTPWIKFGGSNQIQVAADGAVKSIESAKLGFFEPGVAP